MDENILKGQFIVNLTEGDVIPATRLEATEKWIEIENGPLSTKIDPLMLKGIYEVTPETSAEKLLATAESKEEKTTLTNALCGVLEIEQLLQKFHEESRTAPQKIAIFGSTSLTLTILPGRTSHDDAAGIEFTKFCENRARKSHGAQPEFSHLRLLGYLGAWEERASELTGILGTKFLVLHPLDTVMQKLLRIDKDRFEMNDKPDIKRIIQLLQPPEATVRFLLTENPNRYRIPAEKDQSKAVNRNTIWFLKTFLPAIQLSQIKAESEEQEESYLREKGLAPLSLPARNLGEMVKKCEPPSKVQ